MAGKSAGRRRLCRPHGSGSGGISFHPPAGPTGGVAEGLPLLKERIEAGDITPVIDRTYPLARTSEALRYVGAGHPRGKVIISM